MNNKIIYGIIILCIVCIILVSVLSTGHKVLDIILVVISGIGILLSGVYLKRKNKMTAKVAPDPNPNSSSGIVDNENLDPEISNKIATDRDYDVNKNNENSKENLNNNEQKRIQNVQEQRDLDIIKYRKDTQQEILKIIEKNVNNKVNIPSLIINTLFNKTYYTDFFTEYQSEYLIPIQNEDNKDTIEYIISILSRYNKLNDNDKYKYRNAEDDTTREDIINNSNNQKIPEHIERVVTTKSKLSDEVTSKFITDVQENQENNYELNNIITNYIKYLQTQNIDVMAFLRQNVMDNIQNDDLVNIIWKKAWMVDNFNDPDRDPNSLGTGDR